MFLRASAVFRYLKPRSLLAAAMAWLNWSMRVWVSAAFVLSSVTGGMPTAMMSQ